MADESGVKQNHALSAFLVCVFGYKTDSASSVSSLVKLKVMVT